MREILFRGKRIDNGEWVEGNLITGKWYIGEREIVAIAPLDNAFYPHCEMSEWYEVDPATVGQYTGLTDKNGKKIFEGDIIQINYNNTMAYVAFDEMSWTALIPRYKCYRHRLEKLLVYEVKGNIHDNPELLVEDNGT